MLSDPDDMLTTAALTAPEMLFFKGLVLANPWGRLLVIAPPTIVAAVWKKPPQLIKDAAARHASGKRSVTRHHIYSEVQLCMLSGVIMCDFA
jgi:hypothetical protein